MITKRKGWAVLHREDIPDHADPTRTYLTRWRLLQTPWFALYMHCIRMPDTDRALHDHPWPFVSVVLRGGYDEARPVWPAAFARSPLERIFDGVHGIDPQDVFVRRRRPLSVAFRRASDMHRIVRLRRTPTWTLVITGRKTRTWGFSTDGGWVAHYEYFRAHAPARKSTADC
jgi:hypothetical protein